MPRSRPFGPNRSASSPSRSAPIAWLDSCARRSAARCSGLRMFASISRSTSSVSGTGGITSPSWKISRE